MASLTAALTAVTTVQALERYHELRTGWSWDLAYYNQWFWALTRSDGQISVRPVAGYAEEGPSVWKMNYLAPIRLALVPFYMIHPDPRTLLVIQNIMFWWIIPAAYTLARSESRSETIAVSAAALVPFAALALAAGLERFSRTPTCPAVRALGRTGNSRPACGSGRRRRSGDARLPSGIRGDGRHLRVPAPRQPEDLSRTLKWRQALFTLGLAWLLFGFFGYLKLMVASSAPNQFIDQFLGPRATLFQTLETSADLLAYGLGAWALFACLAPRVAVLAVPWIWSLCNGRWSLQFLATEEWHHVRYTVLPVAMILAAGIIGYARLGTWLKARRGGWFLLALVWLVAALAGGLGLRELSARMSCIPRPITTQEADAIWYWIRQVGPEESVLAAYEVTAPLSSRKRLFSYVLEQNKPRGYPQLGSEFQWLFLRNNDLAPRVFLDQGFELVFRGDFLTVLRRASPARKSLVTGCGRDWGTKSLPIKIVASVPMEDYQYVVGSTARIDGHDRASGLEFPLIVVTFMLEKGLSSRGAEDSANCRGTRRIRKDDGQCTASDHRPDNRDETRCETKPHKSAQRSPSNGTGRGARRRHRAVLGARMDFGDSQVASFASPGDPDLILGKTRLAQFFDGGHRKGPVFENANHGGASRSYYSHERSPCCMIR